MTLKHFFLNLTIITTILSFDCSTTFAETNLQYFFGESAKYNDVVVEEVISADTIKITSGEIIKLIGLRAPDPPRRKKRVEYDQYGFPVEDKAAEPTTTIEEQAFKFAQHLLRGKHIRLEFDVEKKDSDFKTLVYAFLVKDRLFVNAEILRQGFADLHLTPANKKYEQELREAYLQAKKEKRGLQSE